MRCFTLMGALVAVASAGAARAEERCRDYADGKRVGVIDDKDLVEASGLVASELQPGVLWSHNDSGGAATLYALDEDGEPLAELTLAGADNVDWEDVALGPCGEDPGGWRDCLFVADTGDNDGAREDQVIYRVAEPDVSDGGDIEDEADEMGISLPDEDDVEALFVDGEGELWLVAKRSKNVRLYGVGMFQADVTVAAELVAERGDIEFVTSADATADGSRIALRSDDKAWELYRPAGRSMRQAFLGEALETKLDKETQGEAIAYDPEGGGFYTTSEGKKAPIRWYRCKSFGASLSGKEDAGGIVTDPGEPGAEGCSGSSDGLFGALAALGAALVRWALNAARRSA